VYSSAFSGNSTIPAGTYVGFEDLAASVSDFNYTDEQFVFSNTSVAPTPIPAAVWLMLSGLGGLGFFARKPRIG
jgi:hypothetical protein